jgi:Domain of unknown function (DUF4349)
MNSMSRAALAVPVMLLVALSGGCGVGGGSGDDAGASSAGRSAEAPSSGGPALDNPGSQSPDRSGGDTDSGAKQAVAPPAMTRQVISTGQLSMHTSSISRARAEVMGLLAAWHGVIADEQTNSDQSGRIVDSTLTLRVPSAKFPEAMEALGRVGEVEQRSTKSEDVTTQVIDNAARVRAAERSIRQIEALLSRAKELSDIIAIESDLARRQADLDSLKSQQAWLADQTSLSTITVFISRVGDSMRDGDEARGFLAGLEEGWSALKGATVLALTAVGAVLPFAVLVALLGVPLWLVVRRRLASTHVNGESAPAQSA